MADKGAAALSLRAIARDMGMTSPALYRYFASRDDLVTALIVDAYHSLADTLEEARDSSPPDDHKQGMLNTGMAYWEWAMSHPQDYALIFGTPIPGYEAPAELTAPAAQRAFDVFVSQLEAADRANKLNPAPVYANPPPALQAQLQAWATKFGYTASTAVLYLALSGWGRLHGLILLVIFHHLDAILENSRDLYRAELLAMLDQSGIK